MHVEALLCALTGAEAGFAVNNGAGAALLAAAALAGPGRSVIVSRGQLVEIGGGFRVPDVIAQAGSRLVEVGTTNRTRLSDYARRARRRRRRHPARAPVELPPARVRRGRAGRGPVRAGRAGHRRRRLGRARLPDVGRARRAALGRRGRGARVFSGDKLLGGPQAGLLVGRAAAVDAARAHPLARALRIDKLSLAALEATLRLHRDAPDEIPVLAMLHAPGPARARAEALAALIPGAW